MQKLAMSEADLQAAVVDFAKLRHWRVYHEVDSRRNMPGLPDLFLVRAPDAFFAELKSDAGRLTSEQTAVMAELNASGIRAVCWRPEDWRSGCIERTLM